MNAQPCGLITGTELWLQWADAHGVRYDGDGKSFDGVARDYYETRDAYRELIAPDQTGSQLATQRAAVNTAYALALLIEAAIERRGGDVDFYVDPVQVRDPDGRIVPRHSTPDGSWEAFSSPALTPEELPQHEATKTDLGLRP